jgi:O-acetyl-ADP-ribose deacetylase (regulator of RNase III)
MVSFPIPPLTLEIADGDIATQDTDAVVNAANNELWMGAGVAGALKAKGGPQVESDAMAQGPIEPGECVVTTFGRLPVPRFVIHAVVMRQDLRTSRDFIERAVRSALRTAEGLGLRSLSMPALGTGVGGFPIDECARVTIGAIRSHVTEASPLQLVRLVLFGQPAYRAFIEVAGELLGPPLDGPADCPVSG